MVPINQLEANGVVFTGDMTGIAASLFRTDECETLALPLVYRRWSIWLIIHYYLVVDHTSYVTDLFILSITTAHQLTSNGHLELGTHRAHTESAFHTLKTHTVDHTLDQ